MRKKSETDSWILSITAKNKIAVPADIQEMALEYHGGKRKAVADLRLGASVSMNWDAFRSVLKVKLAKRKELANEVTKDHEELAEIRKLRGMIDADLDTAEEISRLMKLSVEHVEAQLARLGEEDAANAAE